jgi:hypothetical protein
VSGPNQIADLAKLVADAQSRLGALERKINRHQSSGTGFPVGPLDDGITTYAITAGTDFAHSLVVRNSDDATGAANLYDAQTGTNTATIGIQSGASGATGSLQTGAFGGQGTASMTAVASDSTTAAVTVTAAPGGTAIVGFLGSVQMTTLPTSDPGVSGELWNNGGVVNVSP